MAEQWRVESNKLIFKIGDNDVATISGEGLNDDSVYEGYTSILSEEDLKDSYLTYASPSKADGATTISPGIITLKKDLLDTVNGGSIALALAQNYSGSYYLALEGGTSYGGDTIAAGWKGVNGTASYYKGGTEQSWSLSGNSMAINYTAKDPGTVLVAITGYNTQYNEDIKSIVTFKEWTTSQSGTLTLSNNALSGTSDFKIVEGSGSYILALGDVTKFDALSSTNNPYVTAENGSASIVRVQSAGWSLASLSQVSYSAEVTKILAKISGLSNTAASSNISINNADAMKVTLASGALSTTTIQIKDADEHDDYKTFSLSLAAGISTPGKYFLNPELVLPDTKNGSASIIGTKNKGWSLSGTSFITYTAASQSILAKITGLSTGAKITDTANISLSGLPTGSISTATIGVVLQTDALSTTTTPAAVTDNYANDGFKFRFFLSGVSAPGKYFVDPKLESVTNGSASIMGTKYAGWSLSGTNNEKVYYTASTSSILATIAGLSKDATATNVFITNLPGTGLSVGSISVLLSEGALSKGATPAKLTDKLTTDKFDFKFGFSGSYSQPGKQYGDAFLSIAAVAGGGTSMATVERHLTDGWSLSTAFDKVYYTAASTAILAEIKGLSTTVKSTDTPNISLSGTLDGSSTSAIKVILQEGALIRDNANVIQLTDKIGGNSFTFALATSGVSAPAEKYANFALSSVTNGSASITGSKYEGWTVDASASKVTYTPKIESILAKITGLSTGAKISDTPNMLLMGSDSNAIVQLQKGALSFAKNIPVSLKSETVASGISFSLSLAAGISAPYAVLVGNPSLSYFKNGSASILGTKSEGWSLSNAGLSVTYTPADTDAFLGTIKGLSVGASAANVALIGGGSRIVQLKNGSLSKAGITLNGKDTRTYGFSLSFGNIAEKNADGSVGFESIYYWKKDKNDPTAYYKSDKAEGWVIGGSYSVDYSARNTLGNGVATITNLSKNVEAVQGAVSGITVAGGKIILAKDVLDTGNSSYTMTLTLGHSLSSGSSTIANTLAAGAYGLSLVYDGAGSVPQKPEETAAWISLGERSTYASISAAYWQLANNNSTISYTPQVNGKTLAVVTGLNSAVTADDMKVGGESVITLYKNALATKDVTFENNVGNYSLSLFRSTKKPDKNIAVAAPTLSGQAWSIDGTTAKYTASVQAGYEVANDAKSIIYASTNDSILATITGLSSGLTVSPNKQFIGLTNGNQVTEGLKFGTGDKAKVINLNGDVLTTNSVKLETKSVGRNYSLSFATEKVYDPGDTEVSGGISVWRLNGTTAEYKKVKYAHYSLSTTKDEIIYTPEADVAGGLVAKITGLKNGLAVAADGSHIGVATVTGGVSSITAALKLNTPDDKQIYLTDAVLGTTNVSLSGTGYTFNLDGATSLKPAMQDDSLKWSVNSTTADLKGTKTAGYSVASNKLAVNYIAKDTNYLFAQVAGLKSGLATTGGKITGISLSVADKTITLDNRVLGGTNVTLDNKFSDASFSLALDTTTTIAGASVNTLSSKSIDVWTLGTNNGASTASFDRKNEAYYTLADNSHSIKYTGRTAGTNIVTIKNIKSGFEVKDDKIAGIDLIAAGGKSYTISESVLNEGDATITKGTNIGDYKFTLADSAAPVAGNKYWGVEDTTAKYQYTSTAGYTQATVNGNITYVEERNSGKPNIIAQISGIKSGLNATKVDNGIDVIEDANGSTAFSLYSAVLGSTSITVAAGAESVKGATYSLVLQDPDTYTVKEKQLGWQKSGNNLVLHHYTAEGFSAASNSSILKYYAQTLGASIASVSGLKTNLSVGNKYQISGIGFSVANEDAPVVLLSKNVLNAKDVIIKNNTGGGVTASLSLAAGVDAPKYTMTWAINNSGTATLTEVLNAGYSAIDGDIKYSAKETVKTTIAGLDKNKATVSSNDKSSIEGISLYENGEDPDTLITKAGASTRYTIPKTGTFVIADSVLNNKDLVLSSGASYGLSLANPTNIIELQDPAWAKTVGSAQAFYVMSASKAGYVPTEGDGEDSPVKEIKYYSKGDFKTLATLNGLNKTATATQVKAGLSVSSKAYGGTGGYSTASIIYVKSKDILTNTNLTIGTTDDYVLALDDSEWTVAGSSTTEKDTFAVHDAVAFYTYSKGTVNVQAGKTEGWSIKETKTKGSESSVADPKTIVYTKAAPLTIATVTGLKSDLADSIVSDGFRITNWARGSASTGTGVIKLSKTVLNEKDVKITVPTKLSNGTDGKYGFTFDLDTNIPAPIQGENKWVASATQAKKGTLHYQYNTTAGYSLGSDSTVLKYSKNTDTVLATITGLKNLGSATINADDNNISYLDVTTAYAAAVTTAGASHAEVTGVIKLKDSEKLDTSVVKVTNGAGKYIFDIDSSFKVSDGGSKWFLSGTTGTYKLFTTKGWYLGSGSTTAIYQKETGGNTLVTVKGLKKGLTADKLNDATTGLKVTTTASGSGTVAINSNFEGTTTISLTDGKEYTPAGASQPIKPKYTFTDDFTPIATNKPTWNYYKKGTATLTEKAETGFTINDKADKLTFKKGATYTLATITGLAGNLSLSSTYTSDTSLTQGAIYSGGSLSSENIVVSLDNTDYITLQNDALTNKKVTLKNGKNYAGHTSGYKLALAADVLDKQNNATQWVLNGTTGTYKNYEQSYYTVGSNSTSIIYNKPTTGKTFATVTGLNKTTTTAALLNANWSGNADGGVLTLTKDMLGTATIKMTAKTANTGNRDTFTLALDNNVPSSLKSSLSVSSSATAGSGNKAKITGTFSKGFYLENGNKTLTYYKATSKSQTIATVTGIKGSVNVNSNDGIITLNEGNLNKKNVTVITSKGNVDYKLSYNGDLTLPATADREDKQLPYVDPKKSAEKVKNMTWTNPKGTGTLKGYVKTGSYSMAGSSTSITYTADTGTKLVNVTYSGTKKTERVYKSAVTLATIKGLQKNAEVMPDGDTFKLSGSNTNGNLTVDAGIYKVDVDDTYKGKSITGSAKADNITVAGTTVTVTGGKGDDYIDLGSANSNTFVYSNGDGNDVIANFAVGQDKLQIKSGTISIKDPGAGNDLVVKVGTGSITLKNAGSAVNEITIYNAKNVATTYAVPGRNGNGGSADVLLADDNYSMDAAQLSDIIKPAAAQYTPYDFTADFSLTKEEKFTPEITYTDKK